MLGPFTTASRRMPPVLHCQVSLLSHADCASMSTTTSTTTTTTTTRDRGDRYGSIEWAQLYSVYSAVHAVGLPTNADASLWRTFKKILVLCLGFSPTDRVANRRLKMQDWTMTGNAPVCATLKHKLYSISFTLRKL